MNYYLVACICRIETDSASLFVCNWFVCNWYIVCSVLCILQLCTLEQLIKVEAIKVKYRELLYFYECYAEHLNFTIPSDECKTLRQWLWVSLALYRNTSICWLSTLYLRNIVYGSKGAQGLPWDYYDTSPLLYLYATLHRLNQCSTNIIILLFLLHIGKFTEAVANKRRRITQIVLMSGVC